MKYMKEAMEMCPRYSKCSVNKCYLDSDIDLRNELADETMCNMEKAVRLRIGTEYGLPKLGLTNKEFSMRQSWENKTDEEKIKIKERLAETGFKKRDQNRS